MGLALVGVVSFACLIGIAYSNAASALALEPADFLGGRFGLQLDELLEGLLDLGQRNPVLWALGACQAGLDVIHVQRQRVTEGGFLARQAP